MLQQILPQFNWRVFSGRTLIDWKCEVTPTPNPTPLCSTMFEEYEFQCYFELNGSVDLGMSLVIGRFAICVKKDTASHSRLIIHFMILARHHAYKLCRGRKRESQTKCNSRIILHLKESTSPNTFNVGPPSHHLIAFLTIIIFIYIFSSFINIHPLSPHPPNTHKHRQKHYSSVDNNFTFKVNKTITIQVHIP